MICGLKRAVWIVAVCMSTTLLAFSEVKITVDHNIGDAATSEFKFRRVPAPVKDQAAFKIKPKLIVGEANPSSGGLSALTDGALPEEEDQPKGNFFFASGADGGRFLLDLGSVIEVAQVNTYSWHPDVRAPQIYNLFVSDGSTANFNPEPDANTDPLTCGWKLIATVDTRPKQGDSGGQYGVSIADSSGSLGKIRYLLFDSIPTEDDDPWGNTFYSELNVLAKK